MRQFNIKSFIILLAFFIPCNQEVRAIQTDPALTTAVSYQTQALLKVFSKRKDIQEKILAADGAINTAMVQVHNVEKKMLKYLSEASEVMNNLYQIKHIVQLSGVEIPQRCVDLKKALPGHLEGTAISFIVSKEIVKVGTEVGSLAPFVTKLVTSGSYETVKNGETTEKKVNLLNSAERYYIANEIERRLVNISRSLLLLKYQVKYYTWRDLWMGLSLKTYYSMIGGKAEAEYLIRRWKNLK